MNWEDTHIVGRNRYQVASQVRKLFTLWDYKGIAVPGGQDISKMDQTLIQQLKREGHPGLVLFSSGSTGEPKAALHDATLLLEKFKKPRPAKTMLFFMMFDHIGGINTLLHARASNSRLVTVSDRKSDTVARAIQEHQVAVLPTTPTFLRLLLLSGAHHRYNLNSLELITYGTEPMPQSTLTACIEAFPHVRFQQTYGLSELGILSSRSRPDGSTWVQIGGDGYETRVVDGLLEIKARSAMLGYLNAPSPFTEDGWFKTGDAVEIDGEWMRILGRKSEMINVGGQKVYPAEVENELQKMRGVTSALAWGEPHPLTGQLVKAAVILDTAETVDQFRIRMRFALNHMDAYKIPQRIELVDSPLHNERFKKDRACSLS